MTTNSQLKYKRAIEFCDRHKDSLPQRSKFRLMTTANLYRLLDEMGYYWRPDCQKWWLKDRADRTEAVTIVEDVDRPLKASGRTLIRIIAHRDRIGKRVAEITELCEALNWRVVRTSDILENYGIEFVRVHLTVMVVEDDD